MSANNINFLKKELDKINILFKKKNYLDVIKKSKLLLKKNLNQHIIYNYIGLSYLEINNLDSAKDIISIKERNNSLELLKSIGILTPSRVGSHSS